jgi:Na+/proline symporter
MVHFRNLLILVAIFASCIFYIIIGRNSAKTAQHPSDFLLYRKSLGAGKIFGTLYASGMSLATVFIAFFILAPFFGISLIWSAIFYSLGYFVLYIFLNKIFTNTTDGKTIHGFLGKAYDDINLTKIASITTTIGFMGIFSTEIFVGANILSDVIPYEHIAFYPVILFALIVISYSVLGGLKSVILTDKYQAIATIISVILIFIIALLTGKSDGKYFSDNAFRSFFLSPLLMINFFLINVPFPLIDMTVWQRVAAVKSINDAKRGIWGALITFIITWVIILLSAMLLTENSSLDSSGGLSTTLINFTSGFGVLGIIFGIITFPSLIAAMLSTADTYLVASSQTIIMDIKERKYFDKNKIIKSTSDKKLKVSPDDRRIVTETRKFMFIWGIIGILVVFILGKVGFNVADLVFAIYGSSLSLLPAVLFALIKKYSVKKYSFPAKVSVIIGLISGWTYGFFSVLSQNSSSMIFRVFKIIDILPGDPSAYNSPTIAILFSTIAFLIISLLKRKEN